MTTKQFFITLAAGCLVALIIFKFACNKPVKPDSSKPAIQDPVHLVDSMAKVQAASDHRSDSIAAVNKRLSSDQQAAQQKYVQEKGKVSNLQDQLKEQVIALPDSNDYEDGNRSALIRTVDQLREDNRLKDSACEATISICNTISANKDSIIAEKTAMNLRLKTALDSSAGDTQKMISYTDDLKKQYSKQVRREKFGKIIYKIAAVAAGIFILKQNLK